MHCSWRRGNCFHAQTPHQNTLLTADQLKASHQFNLTLFKAWPAVASLVHLERNKTTARKLLSNTGWRLGFPDTSLSLPPTRQLRPSVSAQKGEGRAEERPGNKQAVLPSVPLRKAALARDPGFYTQWSLNNIGLNLRGSTFCRFFSVNMLENILEICDNLKTCRRTM